MARFSRAEEGLPSQVSEKDRQRNLEFMQIEALASDRVHRGRIIASRDERRDYIPTASIDRRIGDKNTVEYHTAQKNQPKLAAWNSAWTVLQDECDATENLEAVNEGLGQTHRGKLQSDDSVKFYKGEDSYYRRGNQGVRATGRGGGPAGRNQGRAHQSSSSRPTPVKRTRVVKGSSPNQPSSTRGFAMSKTASGKQPVMSGSPSKMPSTTRNALVPKLAVPATAPHLNASRPTKPSSVRPSREAAMNTFDLVTPDDFMASVLRSKAPSATASNGSEHKSGEFAYKTAFEANSHADVSPVQTDLMDLDIGTETPQTTIDFTHGAKSRVDLEPDSRDLSAPVSKLDLQSQLDKSHPNLVRNIEALKALGGLNMEQLKLLDAVKAQSAQVILQTDKRAQLSKIPVGDLLTTNGHFTASSVRSDTIQQVPQAPEGLEFAATPAPAAPAIVVDAPSSSASQRETIARHLINGRAAFIGEHVHRTTFHRSDSSEASQRLSDVTETPTMPKEVTVNGHATTNPFGPPKPTTAHQPVGGPSLPAHLASRAPVIGPRAAVRAQYGRASVASHEPEIIKPPAAQSKPSLPAHLANLPPMSDAGAAVRAQYASAANITSRGRGVLDPASSKLNSTGFIGLAENRK